MLLHISCQDPSSAPDLIASSTSGSLTFQGHYWAAYMNPDELCGKLDEHGMISCSVSILGAPFNPPADHTPIHVVITGILTSSRAATSKTRSSRSGVELVPDDPYCMVSEETVLLPRLAMYVDATGVTPPLQSPVSRVIQLLAQCFAK